VRELIFASKNKGKILEVKNIFSDTQLKIVSLLDLNDFDDITEDGITFESNAMKKAYYVYNKYKKPVIADDSGLSVDQLNDRPGVYSARYSGENASDDQNNRKLIEELMSNPEPHFAKYICAAVYYDGSKYLSSLGEMKGVINLSPRGSNGFGYDPLFVPENYSATLAELNTNEKNKISHRAKAFIKLKSQLSFLLL
jgi:XTP/dITP diphosphohydrolase